MTGLIQILATGMNGTFVLPEMIVVAIRNTDRMRDLSPTHVDNGPDGKPSPAMKTSGGMPNFLSFIRGELIPHIDSTYRTAPYRVLVGHSLGGITVVDALYTMPATFNAYLAIDPSDTTVNQHFNAIPQFDGVLRAYNRSGLRYSFRYYPDDSHGSVPLAAEYDGLRFIFQDYAVNLAQAMDRPAYLTEQFARISDRLGVTFLPPESMVGMLASFVAQQDKDKALALFQLNATLYPGSAQVHQALGNVWRGRGDTAQAIAAYERALAIAPGRTLIRDNLAKLKKKP